MVVANRSSRALALAVLVGFLFIHAPIGHAQSFSGFVYPLVGTRISSQFGVRNHPVRRSVRHHNGIDLAAPYGAHIRAVKGGRVVFADEYAGYGKFIVIQHNNEFTTHYGHCQSILVRPGEIIKPGQIIGTVGSSGLSTGPHLHFEIRINGEPQAPDKFIPGLADEALG